MLGGVLRVSLGDGKGGFYFRDGKGREKGRGGLTL